MNKGVAALRRGIPRLLEDAENGLSEAFRTLLSRGYEQLLEREGHIDDYTRQVVAHSRQHEQTRRLQTLPGFGPIVASVFASVVGDGSAFKRGRDVSACLGWCRANTRAAARRCCWGSVNRATSTCAACDPRRAQRRAACQAQGGCPKPLVNRVRERRGTNKAAVALANKLARMAGRCCAMRRCIARPRPQ